MPLLVEMGWGGLVQAPDTITWTDITPYVDVTQKVVITRGASDEFSEAQPGTATLRLDNERRLFSPGHSGSPYYPFVRRNAPIRISVAVIPQQIGAGPTWPLAQLGDDFDDGRVNTTLWPTNTGGATETSAGRLRIPMTPGVDTSFASARVWTLASSQVTAKLARTPTASGSSSATASMWVTSTTAGTRIGWHFNAITRVLSAMTQVGGADATPTSFQHDVREHVWLRIREAGGTVYWETSGDGYSWTTARTLATPAWVASQVHAVEFPTSRTGGTASEIEWDLVGAVVRPRFWGMVNDWPVRWSGLESTVSITATDIFKRLNRMPPLRSMLSEEILQAAPLVYYPLAEPSTSTSAGDLSGTAAGALAITQAGSGGTLEFAAGTGPPAAGEPCPMFTPASTSAGKYLTADLGQVFQDTSSSRINFIECWFSTSTTGRVILAVASADQYNQMVFALSATGTLQIEYTEDAPGATTVVPIATGNLANGQLHHIAYDEYAFSIYVDGVTYSTGSAPSMGRGMRNLSVGGYKGTRLWSGSIAHLAFYANAYYPMAATLLDHRTAGTTGFEGETADARIARLARYAGLDSVTISGTTHDPVASQGPAGTGALARMREVEVTESAKLFARRDWYGLAYQSRDVRYNPDPLGEAFTIAYADLDTSGVEVTDDDQKLVNTVDASRPGGATQRVAAPESVATFGPYERSLDLLKTSDNSVLDAAYWLVSRYANLEPELREVPVDAATLPTYLDILDADISSYFSVTAMPSQAPAPELRVTVEGYTETLSDVEHHIQFRTSRSATDSVWVLGDPTYGVLDSTTRLAY
ncbi:LamG-like jellyroll fold domain-containing protein [Streptomyces enissocaesilis]|uniref:LamG-like jellyroll fold domain-containing protein n=1 Tax=Streptomyces enissocaesilis TaxID=332589 RepID=A0ABP6JFV9_9ACTN